MCYCKDVSGLMIELLGYEHDNDEWRLFINSSKTSLKAILLLLWYCAIDDVMFSKMLLNLKGCLLLEQSLDAYLQA